MKTLVFDRLIMNLDGSNLTVRRGTKWSLSEGDNVALGWTLGNINPPIKAHISRTVVVRFQDLNDCDLWCEHDPTCRTVKGLFKELKRLYPFFDRRELVTLVYFRIAAETTKDR